MPQVSFRNNWSSSIGSGVSHYSRDQWKKVPQVTLGGPLSEGSGLEQHLDPGEELRPQEEEQFTFRDLLTSGRQQIHLKLQPMQRHSTVSTPSSMVTDSCPPSRLEMNLEDSL